MSWIILLLEGTSDVDFRITMPSLPDKRIAEQFSVRPDNDRDGSRRRFQWPDPTGLCYNKLAITTTPSAEFRAPEAFELATRHLIFRLVWRGVNLLLVVVLVSSVYAGIREYSVRRYLDGFSDAIVPNAVPEETEAPGNFRLDACRPSRAIATDPDNLRSAIRR